eukprot:TRINITY_DN9908_c0_g1_i1.p1 TRINITY_DN9908_c0_g1~~TRINITY_DN9908_c0_g1_i1.p1  ORF type:complete len:388 (+),score=153.56 TRINITY_DN9908_c0_g1_i1:64-1227(+)
MAPIDLPIKVSLLKKKGKTQEIHRARLTADVEGTLVRPVDSLDAVMDLARGWAGVEVRLFYTDEDEDRVQMTAENEWAECVRLWGGKDGPLRLEAELTDRKARPSSSASTPAASTVEPVAPPAAASTPTTPVLPEPATPPATAPPAATPPAATPATPTSAAVAPSEDRLQQQERTTKTVLKRLYGPHVFDELAKGVMPDADAADWLSVRNVGEPGEVDVTINPRGLALALCRKASALIDVKDLDAARDWLCYAEDLCTDEPLIGSTVARIRELRASSAPPRAAEPVPPVVEAVPVAEPVAPAAAVEAVPAAEPVPVPSAPPVPGVPVPAPSAPAAEQAPAAGARENGIRVLLELGIVTDGTYDKALRTLDQHNGNVHAAVWQLLDRM